jgi:pimeloyl-ACP methyl ester carboxylesterase
VRSLLDRLHLERVIFGGVSMGGYVAFGCMRLFPERVTALVLANTRAEPDSEEMRETRNETALSVAEEGVGILVDLQMERLLAPYTLQNDEELVENVRAMIFENSPDGVVAALGALTLPRSSGRSASRPSSSAGRRMAFPLPRSWAPWPRRYQAPAT